MKIYWFGLQFHWSSFQRNITALVQIMVCHRLGDKPLSEPMMIIYWRIYASLGLSELKYRDLWYVILIKPHPLLKRSLFFWDLCQCSCVLTLQAFIVSYTPPKDFYRGNLFSGTFACDNPSPSDNLHRLFRFNNPYVYMKNALFSPLACSSHDSRIPCTILRWINTIIQPCQLFVYPLSC